jgi:hypothetical protein
VMIATWVFMETILETANSGDWKLWKGFEHLKNRANYL